MMKIREDSIKVGEIHSLSLTTLKMKLIQKLDQTENYLLCSIYNHQGIEL